MRFLLFTWCFLIASVEATTLELPELNRPVIDETGMLSPVEQSQLEDSIRQLHQHGGPQVGIFLAANLRGLAVEDFSIKLAEAWQLGKDKKDEGLVVLVSKQERKVRLEVGSGLEGELTDHLAHQFIEQILKPRLRANQPAKGLQEILQEVGRLYQVELGEKKMVRRVRRQNHELSPSALFLFIILFFVVLPILRRSRSTSGRSYYHPGIGWGGGYAGSSRSSGWSSGGGSWGGGGGGFSGGGASGDW